MISELEHLEETIRNQEQTILHLSSYCDKLVKNRDKIRGLIIDYDTGKKTGDMVVSYLKVYVE